jgi:RNA polymerase sigma factor (sigma-70 family)
MPPDAEGLALSAALSEGLPSSAQIEPSRTALSDIETARLVERAVGGEHQAFEQLARAHLRASYCVSLAVVGRVADAEDVAQEALLLAFKHLHTCRDPLRFKAWLHRIVRNRAYSWLKGRRLRDVPNTTNPPEQTQAPAPIEAASLARALGLIGAVQREVVLLHDLEGWTHGEIAEALGISEVMSRQHLFQARRRLRARLEGRSRAGGLRNNGP